MRRTVDVEVDVDDFTNDELIDGLDWHNLTSKNIGDLIDVIDSPNLTSENIEHLTDVINNYYKKKGIKRNVTENCIIIDSINVFEGKSIMDVIKLEETVENLKKG